MPGHPKPSRRVPSGWWLADDGGGDSKHRGSHADAAEKDSDVAGDEADIAKSAQTLFTWSEFMAQATPKSKGRARNEQPALSLFEWAVAVEQEEVEEKVAVSA